MSDLDTKLALIVEDIANYTADPSRFAAPMKTGEQTFIEQIKQVFAAETMPEVERMQQEMANILAQSKIELTRLQMTPSQTYRVIGYKSTHGEKDVERVMTGEEWYDRYRQEVREGIKAAHLDRHSKESVFTVCDSAAKKAAGLE